MNSQSELELPLTNQRRALPEQCGEHEPGGGEINGGLGELVLEPEEGPHHRDVPLHGEGHSQVDAGGHGGLPSVD